MLLKTKTPLNARVKLTKSVLSESFEVRLLSPFVPGLLKWQSVRYLLKTRLFKSCKPEVWKGAGHMGRQGQLCAAGGVGRLSSHLLARFTARPSLQSSLGENSHQQKTWKSPCFLPKPQKVFQNSIFCLFTETDRQVITGVYKGFLMMKITSPAQTVRAADGWRCGVLQPSGLNISSSSWKARPSPRIIVSMVKRSLWEEQLPDKTSQNQTWTPSVFLGEKSPIRHLPGLGLTEHW